MYTIIELLEQHPTTMLCRAVSGDEHRPVVLKVLRSGYPARRDLERIKREYEIGRKLDLPAMVKTYALELYKGQPALVMEDFGGQPLTYLLNIPMALEQFLPISISLCAALAEIHRHGLIHKDIKPANIFINSDTGELKIAGFGIASLAPCEPQTAQDPCMIEGTLPYISPEQTGRMNRAIDHRSDLYSLGVTLYQMLTGNLPFHADDPLEWVHCHIAIPPTAPCEVVASVPRAVSDLVLKLLTKSVEHRYQSASGLKVDLDRCLHEWMTKACIQPFPLGERDISEHLQNPQRLYGREQEAAALLQAFEEVTAEEVTAGGAQRLTLVSGYSGVGKSSLVHELHRPIVRERGFFLSGKFDQHKRDVPYSTIVEAFRSLTVELLAGSEERVAAWRHEIQAALGVNGRLIVDVIPQLELIVGPQPLVPELPLNEAQSRFHMMFRQLIMVFARKEHPVALFLDDLQWADLASLKLLQHVITHPETKFLFVIGAYRDNEVNPSHPLMMMLDEICSSGTTVHEIVLRPLSTGHLCQLVADLLHCRQADAEPLAVLLREKTAGNPFFALQFLATLHLEHLLEFDASALAWRWDLTKIRQQRFTDNVADLMVAKLKRLPTAAQDTLKLAACIGNTVDIHTLQSITNGRGEEEIHLDLWEPAREGLLVRTHDAYKFLHDRVQQAAYSLIPEDARPIVHLRIGRLLRASIDRDSLAERVFDIVSQLNLGLTLISDQTEKDSLAELNLLAGTKSKASAAYESAKHYFHVGIALLSDRGWEAQHERAYTLFLECAQCEYLIRDFVQAERLCGVLLEHARTRLEKAGAFQVAIDLHTNQGRNSCAVADAVEALRLFGIDLCIHPTEEQVRTAYRQVWDNLGDRAIEDLLDLPPMADPEMRAALGVMTSLLAPAQMTDQNLPALLLCHMVNMCLFHGNASASAMAYAGFGCCVVGSIFGSYKEGYRFGKIACDLMERGGDLAYRAKIYNIFGTNFTFWIHHIRVSIEFANASFRAAIEVGDQPFSCYACLQLAAFRFVKGDHLEEVYRTSERSLDFVRRAKYDEIADIITSLQRLIQNMRGRTASFSTFSDDSFDQDGFVDHLHQHLHQHRGALAVCWHYIYTLQARYLSGDYEAALAAAHEANGRLWTSPSMITLPEYYYYHALTLAAIYDSASLQRQKEYLETLMAHQEQLRRWADNGPENFLNKYALVSAEIARITGDALEAMRWYEQAIISAQANGFVQNQAMSCELAVMFYQARGFERGANTYLREARACYSAWGAGGKVKQLDQRFPQLVERTSLALSTTVTVCNEQLDLLSVVKASQSISGEIVLARLQITLMRFVIEQAGAQNGFLILPDESERTLAIHARADIDGSEVRVELLQAIPLSSALLPVSIIHYVARTKRSVIMADAAGLTMSSSDEYMILRRPRSLICIPILRQAEVAGIIYMENNLVAGVFTPDRLMVLEVLAAQAAISLENAKLYSALQESRERLQAIIDNTTAVIYVKDLHWRYVLINRQYENRFYVRAEKIAGKTDFDIFPSDMAARIRANDEKVLEANASLEGEEVVPQDDGLHTYLFVKFPLRDTAGVPYAICGISTDITERKKAEEERARLLEQEQEARASAEEAVRTRDDFLSIASHELYTPIAGLKLSLQRLLRDASKAPGEPPRLLYLAEQQSKRLTKLIEELLNVARIRGGKLDLHLEEVDLVSLCRAVVEQLVRETEPSHCTVSWDAEKPVVGTWDRARLEQVVTNLVSNARKYGAGKPIEVGITGTDQSARLIVADHGIGIPPDRLPCIFERFERAVSARHYGGLGLGLYIARQIVHEHGGSICVQSEPGKGSVFTVELPRRL